MKNITAKLRDINPTDQVFEHEGRYVKVRIVRLVPPPGSPSFGVAFLEVSGSETNSKGRALSHGEGYRIAAAERRTIQYDETVDVATIINAIREETVHKTLNASGIEDQLNQLLFN